MFGCRGWKDIMRPPWLFLGPDEIKHLAEVFDLGDLGK